MQLLNRMLSRFVRTGTLRIIDAEGRHHLHKGAPGPEVTLRLRDPKLYFALFLNPELRAGEAYMDGTLVIEERDDSRPSTHLRAESGELARPTTAEVASQAL